MYFAIEYLGGRREEEEVVTLFDDASSNDVVRVGNFVPDTYRSMHVCVYKSQWQFLTKYCIPFHFTSTESWRTHSKMNLWPHWIELFPFSNIL